MSRQRGSPTLLVFAVVVLAFGGGALWFLKTQRAVDRVEDTPAPKAATAKDPEGGVPAPVAPRGQKDTVIQGPEVREIPGVNPTTELRYQNATGRVVKVAGAWDYWAKQLPMTRRDGVWTVDLADLKLTLGRYEYKFVVDGQWESGDNRVLYVNLDGLIERPPDLIFAARLETSNRIDVLFRRDVPRTDAVKARLIPEAPVSRVVWRDPRGAHRLCGYSVGGDFVTFYFDEAFYGVSVPRGGLVAVSGTFNNWRTDGAGGQFKLHDDDDDGIWSATVRMEGIGAGQIKDPLEFKFVINNGQWLQPRMESPNARSDGKGNLNLQIDPQLSASTVLEVHTAAPLDLSVHYMVVLEGLEPRAAFREVTPGAVLDQIHSTRALGVVLDREGATFRIFSPRATRVDVQFYDGPYHRDPQSGADLAPRAAVPMRRGDDGVWEARVTGVRAGHYYMYRIEGPAGAGEGFNPLVVLGDPYARALAHGDNNSIVIDPAATNAWFAGWTDQAYRTPALADLVIYETHIRDLTRDVSSGVPERLRGSYAGLLATLGKGTGLDHLKALGINAIELMPVSEFANGADRYDWGYGPAFYFAPEASYARDPLRGSQYYEFKHMVNALHRQGFAVILDMVYNHIGNPNVFALIDRKYYFRQDQDYNLENFSGCGNDLRSEGPMMRRLIVDNVLYWIREHHVDGFRFDLGELIDMDTMIAVRDAVLAEKPDAILISEPWSFRGDQRQKLKGTGWSAWNGSFRYAAQDFVRGRGNREDLRGLLRGSVHSWTAIPLQAINYIESHDDMTFTDVITTAPNQDGRNLQPEDAARSRLAATLLFTALGVPMISEGQEWLRSKHGIHNTFDRGDAVNVLRWNERERPAAAETQGYYRDLIRLRQSKAGQTFRWSEAVPDDYFWWIWPEDGRAFGYVMNWTRKYPGAPFLVLLNGAEQPVTFTMELPQGIAWRAIGDGRRIEGNGIPGIMLGAAEGGKRSVTVPGLTGYVFVGN